MHTEQSNTKMYDSHWYYLKIPERKWSLGFAGLSPIDINKFHEGLATLLSTDRLMSVDFIVDWRGFPLINFADWGAEANFKGGSHL